MGGDWLRAHWDFADLDESARRFRVLLETEESAPRRAEVLTQLARVEGLRGDAATAQELLAEAAALSGSNAVAHVRVDLERGRLLRSRGEPARALPLFESAFAAARDADEDFLAADAAHMAALAAPDLQATSDWTCRGMELAGASEDAAYWAGPLLNNLGWAHHEAGEDEAALDAFRRALEARLRRPDQRQEIEVARYAVAKALRALDRPAEAAAELERAVEWTHETGEPDGWFHEELALAYGDLGRPGEARRHAELALELLPQADPSFDEARASQLRELAALPLS